MTGTGGESGFSAARTSDRAYLILNPLHIRAPDAVRAKLWGTPRSTPSR